MTQGIDATALIRSRYEAWAKALPTHDFQWLDENLDGDFQFSARPYSDLRLDKAGFVEVDKKMKSADIRFVMVQAAQIGDFTLSTAVADVKETFDGDMGAHMPKLTEPNELVGESRLAYASAWRQSGERWLCYHHHMIRTTNL
ncbi:hypothetical protein PQR65_39390 [Paraburkholderia nemoris]|uniref:hypothetical protein n=1 Tax=Paraburkholderia nemoris TaxID=2793076 RepID=UPI0038BBD17A